MRKTATAEGAGGSGEAHLNNEELEFIACSVVSEADRLEQILLGLVVTDAFSQMGQVMLWKSLEVYVHLQARGKA